MSSLSSHETFFFLLPGGSLFKMLSSYIFLISSDFWSISSYIKIQRMIDELMYFLVYGDFTFSLHLTDLYYECTNWKLGYSVGLLIGIERVFVFEVHLVCFNVGHLKGYVKYFYVDMFAIREISLYRVDIRIITHSEN